MIGLLFLGHRVRKYEVPKLRIPCYKEPEPVDISPYYAVFVKSLDNVPLDHFDPNAIYLVENDYK